MAAVSPPAATTVPCGCGTPAPAPRWACAGGIPGRSGPWPSARMARGWSRRPRRRTITCRLWDAAAGTLLAVLPAPATTHGLAFTPDGRRIVCCRNGDHPHHGCGPRQGRHDAPRRRAPSSSAVPSAPTAGGSPPDGITPITRSASGTWHGRAPGRHDRAPQPGQFRGLQPGRHAASPPRPRTRRCESGTRPAAGRSPSCAGTPVTSSRPPSARWHARRLRLV